MAKRFFTLPAIPKPLILVGMLTVALVITCAVAGCAGSAAQTGGEQQQTASGTDAAAAQPKKVEVIITSPQRSQPVSDPHVTITGETEPYASVRLTIPPGNIVAETSAGSDGKFTAPIVLPTGTTTITVEATTAEGNTGSGRVIYIYHGDVPETW